jgi:hypothetical protein
MPRDLIFQPMGVLALLIFVVAILIAIRRYQAVSRGEAKNEDFRYGESDKVPAWVSVANRNFMNLLELPVLFYVVCLMFYVARRVDMVMLVLAWAYVLFRVMHSGVHLTYNKVPHRLFCYAASNGALMLLWLLFFLRPG